MATVTKPGKEITPAKSTTPSKGEEEETTPSKVVATGRWDTLAYWVVLILVSQVNKNLKSQAARDVQVTSLQVATFIHDLNPQGFKALEGVQAIPQGVTLEDLHSIPLKGEGGWTRKLDNTLWRMCPSKAGDKQAGGGKYPTTKLLIRDSTKRPVTFSLDH